ncbi:hypothetical protein BWQ93_06025 [Sphingopyxis sp. QXT-31]|uniref:hypothetical protein n=1 Tax=Sphingopyxis sp. QXT-31 TaxID=1357916 RepID=UPI0009796A42|nr:hypothetical protein [Sphingopyxis sp. QXT-31]APZ98087.1 hypothetical protein BWQ93_06025 [Sphingopyxis sp. QXT-31]
MAKKSFSVPYVERDLVADWLRNYRGQEVATEPERLGHVTMIAAENEGDAARAVERLNPGFVAMRDYIRLLPS